MFNFAFIFAIFFIPGKSQRAYLLPAKNGAKSKIADRNYISSEEIKHVNDKWKEFKLNENTRGVLEWLVYWETCPYVLGGVNDLDTMLTWFEPPAKCSVLAYRVVNINEGGDTTQNEFTTFFAELHQDIDYINDYNEYHGHGAPGPPPIDSIIQTVDTFCYGFDSIYTVIIDTLDSPYDNGLDIFGAGWIKDYGDSCPNPYTYVNTSFPYHTLMHREFGDSLGWYSSYHELVVWALVSIYENPPPEASVEDLPDTYSTGERRVNANLIDNFGIPEDSTGVEDMVIQYRVNSWGRGKVYGTLFLGDSADGLWRADIPGQNPGDTVEYRCIATDYQGKACTTGVKNYIVREGTEGNFLWVEDDYTRQSYPELIQRYSHIMDFWDYEEYGPPDSSVIAFYTEGSNDTTRTIVWKTWGSEILGLGVDFGAGVIHTDSNHIKRHLESGGNFLLSDQDQGYSLGVTNYGQADVFGWVRDYLGIEGLYDDDSAVGGRPLSLSSTDPVYSDLFGGLSSQDSGEVFLAPYYSITGGFGYAYTCVFDSVLPFAITSMITEVDGKIVSYRLDGTNGTTHSGKVANFGFPFEFIADPADSLLDTVAVDTLFKDVMDWFGVRAGLEDESVEPGRLTELFPIGVSSENVRVKFYLPKKEVINLAIYDITGRKIKTIENGLVNSGLNIRRVKLDYPAGVYFIRLRVEGESLTEKMILVR